MAEVLDRCGFGRISSPAKGISNPAPIGMEASATTTRGMDETV
jgi:hypothetical protein